MKKFLNASYEITMRGATKTFLTIGVHRLLLLLNVAMILILMHHATVDVAGHVLDCTGGSEGVERP